MGFINLIVADRLGTVDLDRDAKTQIVGYSLIWSIFDFAIFIYCQQVLSRFINSGPLMIATSLMVTLVIAFILTLTIAPPLNKLVYHLYNKRLGNPGNTGYSSGKVLPQLLNGDKKFSVYIYNFDHTPVEFGILDRIGFDSNGCANEITVLPIADQTEQPDYESVRAYIAGLDPETTESYSYLDFSSQQIFIFLIDP